VEQLKIGRVYRLLPVAELQGVKCAGHVDQIGEIIKIHRFIIKIYIFMIHNVASPHNFKPSIRATKNFQLSRKI
jgi:hypothetical protein